MIKRLFLLIAVTLLLYLTNLSVPALWDDDETYFAATAAEMYRRGDWNIPYLNGEFFNHKPILMYWQMLLGFSVFGISELGARIGSVFFALATLGVVYRLGNLFFGRHGGFWSAMSLAVALMFTVEARAATPDAALTFFVTLSLYLWITRVHLPSVLSQGTQTSEKTGHSDGVPSSFPAANKIPHSPLLPYILVYIVMGFGVLTKGPLAVIVPCAIIGMFLWLHNVKNAVTDMKSTDSQVTRFLRFWKFFPITVWQMRPITIILVILAVAGPWYFWVGHKTGWFAEGAFWNDFFYFHHFKRGTTTLEGHGGAILTQPWMLLAYPISLLVGFFPMSIFTIPAVLDASSKNRKPKKNTTETDSGDKTETTLLNSIGYRFVICWCLVWMGIFTVLSTKLPSYIVPMYPGFALLIGAYLSRLEAGTAKNATFWLPLALKIGIISAAGFLLGGSIAVCWLGLAKELIIPIFASLLLIWFTVQGIVRYQKSSGKKNMSVPQKWYFGGTLAILFFCSVGIFTAGATPTWIFFVANTQLQPYLTEMVVVAIFGLYLLTNLMVTGNITGEVSFDKDTDKTLDTEDKKSVDNTFRKKTKFALYYYTLGGVYFILFLHAVGAPRIAEYSPARAIGFAIQTATAADKTTDNVVVTDTVDGASENNDTAENGKTGELREVWLHNIFRPSWYYYGGGVILPQKIFGGGTEFAEAVKTCRPAGVIMADETYQKYKSEGILPPGEIQEFRDFKMPKRRILIFYTPNDTPNATPNP